MTVDASKICKIWTKRTRRVNYTTEVFEIAAITITESTKCTKAFNDHFNNIYHKLNALYLLERALNTIRKVAYI